jgi:hypothetical protein
MGPLLCHVLTILLDEWEPTVRAGYTTRNRRIIGIIEEMEMRVEDQMEELEMIRDERYKMTRKVLQEIMETVITLSKFYAVLGEIEKIGHIVLPQK